MAGAHGGAAAAAITSSSVPPTTSAAPIPGKSFLLASSLPSSFPSRRRRTNHLRQKILKTLENKPYPDTPHPEFRRKTPTIFIEEPAQQELAEEVDKHSLSEATGFSDGIVGKFSTRSLTKIGLYLVGAFIFQMICAVIVFGLNDLEGEDGDLKSNDYKKARVLNSGVNGIDERKSKSNSLLSGNQSLMETKEGGLVLVDESEMDNRIREIQELAREARQRERVEAKKKGIVEQGMGDVDYDLIDKTVKEKEVDGRLMKLQKRLEGRYEKMPKFRSKEGDARNDGGKGASAAFEALGPLMFKKKYKYKSPSIDSGPKPRGFDGKRDHYVDNGKLINGMTADDGNVQADKTEDEGASSNGLSSDNGVDISDSLDLPNGNGSEISVTTTHDSKVQEPIDVSMPFSNPKNKLVNRSERAKPRVSKTESIAGTSKEANHEKQAGRAVKSGKSSNLETRKPRGFGKESQSDTATSTKHDDNIRNGSVKGKKDGNRRSVKHLEDVKSSKQTGFWWTSLPYVLAVLMQRGGGDEESEGLFTLRSNLQTKNELSHTVAFEDRGDATNFCYLLESFFEDLGDFSTNIIPIPTNELEEAVKSEIMNVVVVRKGQLQLYVGQPLTDVESALHTLIEQSNSDAHSY